MLFKNNIHIFGAFQSETHLYDNILNIYGYGNNNRGYTKFGVGDQFQ